MHKTNLTQKQNYLLVRMHPQKFECKKCGKCCRNMRGRFYGKPPIIPHFIFNAVSPSLMTIGLFEWEVPILKRNAKRLSIPLQIKPYSIMWDQNSKKAISISWTLDHDNCAFLSEDNRCSIYKNRPLVCQTYPLMAVGIMQDPGKFHEIELGDCPNSIEIPLPKGKPIFIRASTVFKRLFKVYGSSFLGALRFEGAGLLISKYGGEAIRQRILRPAIIKKNTIKEILRSEPIGLIKFLQARGVVSKKETRKQIQSIYSLTARDLRRMIGK